MFGKTWRLSALLSSATLLAACVTTGVGTGETDGGGPAVSFSWSSDNARTGSITATVASTGEEFTGRFFQVTSETRVDELQPLWSGWHSRWRNWPYWGDDFGPSFMTHYSGRVLANLASANGEHMRCNFRLVRPSSGMSSGGQGRCQSPDGSTVDATFPTR
jgi:hypothetical protein